MPSHRAPSRTLSAPCFQHLSTARGSNADDATHERMETIASRADAAFLHV